ncbi:MAG TPA: dihydropteroate synthase [Candidatus Brocadiia bacterium]|nr:dihydropteroate synthase [Candidatus Brocadiia bacterium]
MKIPPAFDDVGIAMNPLVSALVRQRGGGKRRACVLHLEFDIPTAPGEGRGRRRVCVSGTDAELRAKIEAALAGIDRAPEFLRAAQDAVSRFDKSGFKLRLRQPMQMAPPTRVMGILNVTPDSFSDGGSFYAPSDAIARGEALAAAGADVLDIGGESTRPGAAPVPAGEEIRRILPVIEALVRRVDVPISVDTSKASVARAALDAGATIVNDVTALRGDPEMAGLVAERKRPVVLMHMRGDPRTMQTMPRYRDVTAETSAFLRARVRFALNAGIREGDIIIDPGLGFGKTAEHNLTLMRHLSALRSLGLPIMIGFSRKSTIGKVLDKPPQERLYGSLAAAAWATACGAAIVRAHDVEETRQVVAMTQAIKEGRCI